MTQLQKDLDEATAKVERLKKKVAVSRRMPSAPGTHTSSHLSELQNYPWRTEAMNGSFPDVTGNNATKPATSYARKPTAHHMICQYLPRARSVTQEAAGSFLHLHHNLLSRKESSELQLPNARDSSELTTLRKGRWATYSPNLSNRNNLEHPSPPFLVEPTVMGPRESHSDGDDAVEECLPRARTLTQETTGLIVSISLTVDLEVDAQGHGGKLS
ncbi:Uu.00g133830.m01.CDS01 [Anthostomella pinea]|uniref:Uu.00g133830.m01.CDS01 n=1 Tax=Anthostomella pinea TaxID=933095 RepID=A0AAI8YKS7_9PEZI|nr:Uu.00g133830.m01.CDS01 [Anthostomella pinea]